MLFRLLYLALSPFWLLQYPLTGHMIEWHGRAIGGAQYFAHLGVSTYIGALQLLMFLAILLSALLVAAAASARVPSSAIFGLAVIFLVVAVIAWFPVVVPGRGLMQSIVFPYEMKDKLLGMLALAVCTLIATGPQTFARNPRRNDA